MSFLRKAAAKGEKLFRKSHASREATATGLQGSATLIESSGTAETRENSAPATKNAIELVEKFDEVLATLGTSDNSFPVDQTISDRLLELQGKLPQYRLPETDQVWECDPKAVRLILLSAYASKAAYGTPSAKDSSFIAQSSLTTLSEKTFEPSFDGSIKQLAVRLLVPQRAEGTRDTEERTLLVAIRGSVSFADWVTNLNGNAVEAALLSDASQQGHSIPKAHNGLVRVASKMEPVVTKIIEEYLAYDLETNAGSHAQPKLRIILTGHSAGGGVAALLFLYYLRNKRLCLDAVMSCVTFAAPPVISNDGRHEVLPESCEFFSVINEGDPVPRADKPYIFSLADLYGCVDANDGAPINWRPPPAELHIPNESTIVALRVRAEDKNGLQVEINQVGTDEVENTVALDFERHRMCWYIAELEAWARG